MPANKITSVERVITELKLLREWCRIPYIAGEVNATPPTVISDIKELERLGVVESRKAYKGKAREYKLKSVDMIGPFKSVEYFTYEGNIKILRVLTVLEEYRRAGITAAKIAEETGFSPGYVHKILNMFIAVRWVKRFDPEFGPRNAKLYRPLVSIVMRE